MKRILCYGDSNTWGAVPLADPAAEGQRHDDHTRWCGVMRDVLGDGFTVLEDGLNGRTTIYGGAEDAYKNGEPTLLPSLQAAAPLDLVIIMLGTNDLRLDRGVTDDTLDKGIRRLIDIVQAHPECGQDGSAPQVLVISPIHIAVPTGRQDFYEARGCETGVRRSVACAALYARAAADTGCAFMDAAQFAHASPLDALHMEAPDHLSLGKAAAAKVREIFA
ncbi:MAG: hydrolase [Clostridia bacterium]|nr:hydrolase [Clostridia bacterium]